MKTEPKHTPGPINTSLRLFDLVRYMRSELHRAKLITEEEYGWLCYGSDMAVSPEGGSPSRARLEEYDEIIRERETARQEISALHLSAECRHRELERVKSEHAELVAALEGLLDAQKRYDEASDRQEAEFVWPGPDSPQHRESVEDCLRIYKEVQAAEATARAALEKAGRGVEGGGE